MTLTDMMRGTSTATEELTAWCAVVAAVEARDVESGKLAYDEPVSSSPLLRACEDARDALADVVVSGGRWKGELVRKTYLRRW
jgi:hypothetical protein